jgi:hypothetical protein
MRLFFYHRAHRAHRVNRLCASRAQAIALGHGPRMRAWPALLRSTVLCGYKKIYENFYQAYSMESTGGNYCSNLNFLAKKTRDPYSPIFILIGDLTCVKLFLVYGL